jgi:DNA-binding NarL/FixJ family response regulator
MDRRAILIVDDHELLRIGLKSMLESMGFGGVEAIEASTLKEALAIYATRAPEIALVLLDLNLPDSKGLSALEVFKRSFPAARVVVLSGSVDASISGEARTLGAELFLHKAGDLRQIGQLFSDVNSNQRPPVPHSHRASAATNRMRLSAREVEILELVLQGRSNQEIVDTTGLRIGTIKNYISGLLVVFGVSSRSKLISLFR